MSSSYSHALYALIKTVSASATLYAIYRFMFRRFFDENLPPRMTLSTLELMTLFYHGKHDLALYEQYKILKTKIFHFVSPFRLVPGIVINLNLI